MNKVYEEVMLSNPLDDEKRFRKMLDQAIKAGDVHAFTKYTNEPKRSIERRIERAKREAKEAEEAAEEMGLDKNGDADASGGRAAKSGDAGLAALIQQRQKQRAGDLIASLEAKYTQKDTKNSKRRKKRPSDAPEEPPEEAFKATARRGKKAKVNK